MSIEGIVSAASSITPTKRSIITLVGKFYDKLGFIFPVVILFKIFLQELCEEQLNWDETLTGELLIRWQCLSQGLAKGRQHMYRKTGHMTSAGNCCVTNQN